MELITGRTGVQHVKAVDDAEIYRTLLGDGDFVLSTGAKMNAQMNGTNEIDIYNGTAIMQGRQVKIRPSEGYNAVALDNGVSGYKRWDVVCIEYSKEGDIESAELVVIKGANSANYVEPTVSGTSGSIDNGETHRMKLWGVKFNGINFDSLVDYRTVLDTTPIQTALDSLSAIEDQLEARVDALSAELDNRLNELAVMGRTVPAISVTARLVSIRTDQYDQCYINLEKPIGYTYESTDVFRLYLNGLRADDYEYAVVDSGNNLKVGLTEVTETGSYDSVVLDIWKMEE